MTEQEPSPFEREIERFRPLTETEQAKLALRTAKTLELMGAHYLEYEHREEGHRLCIDFHEGENESRITQVEKSRLQDFELVAEVVIGGTAAATERREITGQNAVELIPPDDRDFVRQGDVEVAELFFKSPKQFRQIDIGKA